MTNRVFKKLRPRGYFKVPVVLDFKAFKKCFALYSEGMTSNDGDNVEDTSVDGIEAIVGKSHHSQDEHPRSDSL